MRQHKDILIQNLFEKYKQAIEDAKFAFGEAEKFIKIIQEYIDKTF